ncbi:hypothetical protein GYMLUDRAFT_249147 [Collybiopsis luxurians FD-317 M1]|uniref:Retrotransposon gag domain-containing protein n=1 Tax=Collybiopsis luxurians FD-317 M1 TaxID=944289 RepID=A0A0D0CIG0_9AGAR|nr:hypothetical protein GYMLUDRAFT_249147 [Collybiopsis luxurians FD-317 M1]
MAAISFLKGDTAIWATPIAENITQVNNWTQGVTLTYPDWNTFKAAFKAHFETADVVVDAKESLKHLWQGRNTVTHYTATFKQHASCTGYSDEDLQDCFYEHPADQIKNALVASQVNTNSLKDLINEAICIDNQQISHAREKGKFIVNTPTITAFNPAPFVAPTRDPNAMDVDATTTLVDPELIARPMDTMRQGTFCTAAATSTTPEPSTSTIAAATSATPLPTADFAQILQQLNANQQALAAQIAELHQNF